MVNICLPNSTVSSLSTRRKVGVHLTAMDWTQTDVRLWPFTSVSSFTWTVRSSCGTTPPDTTTTCSCGSTQLRGRPENMQSHWRDWPFSRIWATLMKILGMSIPSDLMLQETEQCLWLVIDQKITCHRTCEDQLRYGLSRQPIDRIGFSPKSRLGPSLLLKLASYRNQLTHMCLGRKLKKNLALGQLHRFGLKVNCNLISNNRANIFQDLDDYTFFEF